MDVQIFDRNRLLRRCETKSPQPASHHSCQRANGHNQPQRRFKSHCMAGGQIIDLFAHHIPHGSNFAGGALPNTTPLEDQNAACLAELPIANTGCHAGSRGALSAGRAVVQAAGHEKQEFTGPDRCVGSEELCNETVTRGTYQEGEDLVVRNERSLGGSGTTKMPVTTAAIYRQGMGDKMALITDKRFSGANRSFRTGHARPVVASGGRTVLIENGDIISIDAVNSTGEPHVSDVVLSARRKNWAVPTNSFTSGCMWEQARSVGPAAKSAMTLPGGHAKVVCHAD